MKEATFLVPVQRIVGGVEIEDDLLRWVLMRFHEQIDEQPLDLRPIPGDPVIARQLRPAQLQPVERAFPRQWCAILAAGRQLAGQHRHRRVMPQLVVIDQVLVAQRNTKHALSDQRHHFVLDQLRCSAVRKTLGKPLNQADRPVGRSQQQRTRVRGHPAAVKPGHHGTPFDGCKTKQIRATLCLHRVSPWPGFAQLGALRQIVGTTRFSQIRDPDAPTLFEKSGLSPNYF
jgi:hypothetical protein